MRKRLLVEFMKAEEALHKNFEINFQLKPYQPDRTLLVCEMETKLLFSKFSQPLFL